MHGWRLCLAQISALGQAKSTLAFLRTQHSVAVNSQSTVSQGLFGHDGLCSPGDWDTVVESTISRCEALARKVSLAPRGRAALFLLDDISNVLCHAVDSANFCSTAHSDQKWQSASARAAQKLNGYLAELNTAPALWKALSQSLPQADAEGWSVEEVMVGESLLAEFEQAGMALGPEASREYRALKAREDAAGLELRRYQGDGRPPRISSYLDLGLHKRLKELRDAPQDTLPDSVEEAIVELANTRHSLARLIGSKSYTHYIMKQRSLAGTPEAVHWYLTQTHRSAFDKGRSEAKELQHFAHKQGLLDVTEVLQHWTLSPVLQAFTRATVVPDVPLRSPIRLIEVPKDVAVAQMAAAAHALLGVHFQHAPIAPEHEAWAPGQEKFEAFSDTRGHLGTVYLDLYHRPGKYTGCAQFTLRCSKELESGLRQKPIVALSLNFDRRNAVMSVGEVETLFHEFGHALNSLLCHNRLQHLSGARGPLDIVELPSHIFENAARKPPVYQHILDSCLPNPQKGAARKLLDAEPGICHNLRTLRSHLLPRLDAQLHGEEPPKNVPELRKLAVDVATGVMGDCVAPPKLGCYPGLSLEHIWSYGGTCHAYLFAKRVADAVWEQHLKGHACNKEILSDALYAPGGAVDVKAALELLSPDCLIEVNGGLVPAPI